MSDQPTGPIQRNAQEARQATTTGHVRWVLLISTVLAVVALFAVYIVMYGGRL